MKFQRAVSGMLTSLLILVFASAVVWAEPPKKEASGMDKRHHGMSGSSPHGKKESKGHGGGMDGMHLYGKSWRYTLTDEQKMKADAMHLELKKASAPLKALLSLKEAELNAMIVKDKPDMAAVGKKIDEILEVKRRLMLGHNEHKTHMRAMLTPDQRISFDMDLLGKGGHGR